LHIEGVRVVYRLDAPESRGGAESVFFLKISESWLHRQEKGKRDIGDETVSVATCRFEKWGQLRGTTGE